MSTEKHLTARLRADHDHIKSLFRRLDDAGHNRGADLFWELTNELVRHEVAEETIVFPVARDLVGNGERLVNARAKEQAEAEELLAQMEREGPDSDDFPVHLRQLESAVLEHADKEERLVFEPLGAALEPERSKQLGEVYAAAKSIAPTHPHPSVPNTAAANLVAGPVAALVDRTRDAMHRLAG